ncbi:MAG: hypothetical protein JW995_04300 [Melioribacteraceae bacterium]|nr:hypothetical protein [Melioribacteraceae bacterium]
MNFLSVWKKIILVLLLASVCKAQFMDEFDKSTIEGWFVLTGDGSAELKFIPRNGYATMLVDASRDKYNVYWTLIKRDVTKWLDLTKFAAHTRYQLRVEARVRLHNAPRRLNFMVNTNRTTNYHIDLMEFDIPDTTNWHVISMTTKKFDARPGDTVYVQMAATDFGPGKYYVDIDYYRADIVDVNEAGPDKGNCVPYHPTIPDMNTFSEHLPVFQDCIINSEFPDVNFNDYHLKKVNEAVPVLKIASNQWAVLRWDFSKYTDAKSDVEGILELTTHSVYIGGNYDEAFGKDFGMEFDKVRVIEILNGDHFWNQETVTYNSLTEGKEYEEVFNSQMVYDFEVNTKPGGKNYITISRPVMQRLIAGITKGLLLRPLGAVDASFYATEYENGNGSAKLHFGIKDDK